MLSGLVALDVVLREREAIAAIPGVVHLLRQFADTPLLTKLHRACEASASAGDLERIVAAHAEAMQQLDSRCARELAAPSAAGPKRSPPPQQQQQQQHHHHQRHTLTCDQEARVNDIFKHAARVGSAAVVEWAMRTSSRVDVYRALYDAAKNGHVAVLERLCPTDQSCSSMSEQLLRAAARYGHLSVLQWFSARGLQSLDAALETAVAFGYVDILQWLYSMDRSNELFPVHRDEWRARVAGCAAASSHQRIADWVCAMRLDADVPALMAAVARTGDYMALKRLHSKYARAAIRASELQAMRSNAQRSAVVEWLLSSYPDRYSDDRALLSRPDESRL